VCRAPLRVLNKHGESLRIYFTFLKLMVYCLFVVGGFAMFNLLVNWWGSYYDDVTAKSVLDYTTIANFKGYANGTTNLQACKKPF